MMKNKLCLRALLVEVQDFKCSFNSTTTISYLKHMICHDHIHEISEPGHKDLSVFPLKVTNVWPQMCTLTN